MPVVRGAIYIPTQLLAGICAGAVAGAIVPGDIATTQTTLADGMSIAQGVFLEMVSCSRSLAVLAPDADERQFLTSLLLITILMLACEKGKQTFVAPIGIGMSLFVTQIAGVSSLLLSHLSSAHMRTGLLHRRLSQPSQILRSMCCSSQVSRLPLDLLGWSSAWRARFCRLLLLPAFPALRVRQPRPRRRKRPICV